ncbi:MAG: adenylate class-3/4/guanylyl cyclase [Rhodospirillales bacterium]|nr:adenylate class-3/4/guanylyl cyclase [Rhodospirillales bacterium]
MAEERVNRRLAAVLAADVVGYSRLVEEDESATLAELKARRRLILEPLLERHQGRLVKVMGDGVLVEFASAVNAVACASDLQREMAAANANLPHDRGIVLRIAINLGDVVVEGGDLYGEGVNVAARLQALAEPGEIWISGNVFDQVEKRLALSYEDLGLRTVKNMAKPIRAYRIKTESSSAPISAAGAPPKKTGIVVLPFTNMSGEAEQDYFSDGITEDITTSLSKLSQLLVIARNSAFTYKGRAVKVQQVGAELGVQYVVEGSIRRAGDRVRITAQLIDAGTGGHLWADRYDRDLTDIFALQDEVTREIVAALAVKLTADEQRRLVRKPIENLEAYDLFLRGREAWWRHTRQSNLEAHAMFERTIALAPGYSPAYAFLSFTNNQDYVNGWTERPQESQERAFQLAQKAVGLDESDATARIAIGVAQLWRREHEEAIANAKASLVLDPNHAQGYFLLGWALHYAGRHEEAIDNLNRSIRLDPHYPGVLLHFIAQAHFALRRFNEAAALLKRRLLRDPDSDISRVLLASCYGHLGQSDHARAEWAAALQINPGYSLEHRRRVLPYKDAGDFERIVDGLRKAGLPV